jgi:hypothetical protein
VLDEDHTPGERADGAESAQSPGGMAGARGLRVGAYEGMRAGEAIAAVRERERHGVSGGGVHGGGIRHGAR